jgi:hypothetical protein
MDRILDKLLVAIYITLQVKVRIISYAKTKSSFLRLFSVDLFLH